MKKIILILLIGHSFLSCSSDKEEKETTNQSTPISYNKLKAYKNNIYYNNITSADWHKIEQNLDTINNIITQDSAQFNGPNIKKTYKIISSTYYENYNNKNANYMLYLIYGNSYKYIMIAHSTNVEVVLFKKFKKESDIEFTTTSQDGEYYRPIEK